MGGGHHHWAGTLRCILSTRAVIAALRVDFNSHSRQTSSTHCHKLLLHSVLLFTYNCLVNGNLPFPALGTLGVALPVRDLLTPKATLYLRLLQLRT